MKKIHDDENRRKPPYLDAVIALGLAMPAGTVQTVHVLHDAWCRLLTVGGECNCNPEVRAK